MNKIIIATALLAIFHFNLKAQNGTGADLSKKYQAKPPPTQPFSKEAFRTSDKTTLRWLGMAGFLVNSRGTTFMIDPILDTFPNTSRIEKAEQKYEELFGQQILASKTDPELMNILQRLIFGEIFYIGNIDDKTRELITITILTTNQTLPQLKSHTQAALNIGLTPIEIREAVYQSAPFIGFPKVLNAMEVINGIFENRGIQLPLENKGTVAETERFEKGRAQQYPLYGEGMKAYMKDLPGGLGEEIPRILTESCFGDFYTREGLDLKTRELLVFCTLATLGGAERQMASHAVGNLKAGNTKETLISAMLHCYPYIGFPRISNAIAVIKEAK